MITVEIQEKFYKVILEDGTPRIVRRDVYWDSGFKSQEEIDLIAQIEKELK